jgi:hypothetical protein
MNSLDAHDVAARSANNFAFSFTKEKTSAMLREFADRIDAREIIVQNVVTKQQQWKLRARELSMGNR